MPRTLTAVLTFGAGASLVVVSAAVGIYAPPTYAPMLIAGVTFAIWIVALILGRALKSKDGWKVWGVGCVAGGVGVIANSLSAGSIGPMVAGGAFVLFFLLFGLWNRKALR